MEGRSPKTATNNLVGPTAIDNPTAREIERLCAHARELITLAMEIREMQREIAAVALQLSRRAVEMRRRRGIKDQGSRLVN